MGTEVKCCGEISERRHFLIVSSARSGSTLLKDLLNNHPGLKCHSELLNREKLAKRNLQDASKDEILSYLSKKITRDKETVVGFKLLLEQLENIGIQLSDILGLMTKPKVIFLYRPDMLDTFVSLSIANKTNKWYSFREVNTESVSVAWEKLTEYIENRKGIWREAQTEVTELIAADDQIKVTYDDLCENKVRVTQDLFEFLQLWRLEWRPIHYSVKQNPASVEDKVDNYEEICELIEKHNIEITLKI